MKQVNVHEAKSQLSRLLEKVETGERVVIAIAVTEVLLSVVRKFQSIIGQIEFALEATLRLRRRVLKYPVAGLRGFTYVVVSNCETNSQISLFCHGKPRNLSTHQIESQYRRVLWLRTANRHPSGFVSLASTS
jgi:hypothetical protein